MSFLMNLSIENVFLMLSASMGLLMVLILLVAKTYEFTANFRRK